nr:threonine synthase [Oscillospiraceae bacterium]
GCCDDKQTMEEISDIYKKYSYTLDTHSAVAVKVYEDYRAKTGDTTKTLIASTASPYKFSASVLEAIEGKRSDDDEYTLIDRLNKLSGYPVPASLAALRNKSARFTDVIGRDDMEEYVLKSLS